MATEIQEALEKLEKNKRTKITFQGKRFFLKKENEQIKILPNLHIGVQFTAFIISLIFSFFIITLIMGSLGYIIDELDLFSGYNSDGTYISVSSQGMVSVLARDYWYIFFILIVLGAYKLSNILEFGFVKIIYKSEYLDLKEIVSNYTKDDSLNSLSDEEKAEVNNKGVLQLLDELEELKSTEITEDKPVNETISTPQRVYTISQSDKVEQAPNKSKYKSIKRVIAREFMILLSVSVLFGICFFVFYSMNKRKTIDVENTMQRIIELTQESYKAKDFDNNYFLIGYKSLDNNDSMSFEDFKSQSIDYYTNQLNQSVIDYNRYNISPEKKLRGIGLKINRSPELNAQWSKFNSTNNSFWMNETLIINLALLLLVIIYVARPLFYAVRWSIKTLKI